MTDDRSDRIEAMAKALWEALYGEDDWGTCGAVRRAQHMDITISALLAYKTHPETVAEREAAVAALRERIRCLEALLQAERELREMEHAKYLRLLGSGPAW